MRDGQPITSEVAASRTTTLLDYVLLLTVHDAVYHKEPMHPTRDVIAISVFSPIPAACLSWPKLSFLGDIDVDDEHEERKVGEA
jgi:hypothetical protein